jgi:predicted NUDIX family NTP pyrophosphohydrolase
MKPTSKSAGILVYRIRNKPEVFLIHPGGPFWAKKDIGSWSIPKGEFDDNEDALEAAKREFKEETGTGLSGNFISLTPIIQKAGKQVYAWAVQSDIDAETIQSNTFKMEWPPKSGQWKSYPEVDKGAWFDMETAKEKINPAQAVLIEELLEKLNLQNL